MIPLFGLGTGMYVALTVIAIAISTFGVVSRREKPTRIPSNFF